jgi:DNA (cytosine-5)-methyltransferase 1
MEKLRELALFAGAGGGILGGALLGWRTVCAVEVNSFCARRLMQRQNEGHLPPFPIWDDVRTFDGRPWKDCIEVVSCGFPCQDICQGSGTNTGVEGQRSGLVYEGIRIIDEIRPLYALLENSPRFIHNGLPAILGTLAEIGYDAEWDCIGAREIGATHYRERVWVLARHAGKKRLQGSRAEIPQKWLSCVGQKNFLPFPRSKNHLPNPRMRRSGDGVAGDVDRLQALGEGQVPAVAATAWCLLQERIEDGRPE